MRIILTVVVALLACATAARGQAPSAPTPDGVSPQPESARFTFNRVDGGFLRLDNQTGQVSFCSARTAGWTCEAVAEDRVALEREIGRLQDEIASLKRQQALADPPPRPPADLSPPSAPRDDTARLREDMERARAYVEDAWRRLVEMLMNFQKDVMRKT